MTVKQAAIVIFGSAWLTFCFAVALLDDIDIRSEPIYYQGGGVRG